MKVSATTTIAGEVEVGVFVNSPTPIKIMCQYEDGSVSMLMFSVKDAQSLANTLFNAIKRAKDDE